MCRGPAGSSMGAGRPGPPTLGGCRAASRARSPTDFRSAVLRTVKTQGPIRNQAPAGRSAPRPPTRRPSTSACPAPRTRGEHRGRPRPRAPARGHSRTPTPLEAGSGCGLGRAASGSPTRPSHCNELECAGAYNPGATVLRRRNMSRGGPQLHKVSTAHIRSLGPKRLDRAPSRPRPACSARTDREVAVEDRARRIRAHPPRGRRRWYRTARLPAPLPRCRARRTGAFFPPIRPFDTRRDCDTIRETRRGRPTGYAGSAAPGTVPNALPPVHDRARQRPRPRTGLRRSAARGPRAGARAGPRRLRGSATSQRCATTASGPGSGALGLVEDARHPPAACGPRCAGGPGRGSHRDPQEPCAVANSSPLEAAAHLPRPHEGLGGHLFGIGHREMARHVSMHEPDMLEVELLERAGIPTARRARPAHVPHPAPRRHAGTGRV